jgi:hypothetical protein
VNHVLDGVVPIDHRGRHRGDARVLANRRERDRRTQELIDLTHQSLALLER